jgi:DNA-binding CsgD family transcriptional regulator
MTSSSLSPREREVLILVVAGCPNKEIAFRLGISYQTAKMHVGRLLRRLGVSSRVELVREALTRRLVKISARDRSSTVSSSSNFDAARELAAGRTMKQAAHALGVSTRSALPLAGVPYAARLRDPSTCDRAPGQRFPVPLEEMSATQAERPERDDGNRSRPRRLGAFALALARSF